MEGLLPVLPNNAADADCGVSNINSTEMEYSQHYATGILLISVFHALSSGAHSCEPFLVSVLRSTCHILAE